MKARTSNAKIVYWSDEDKYFIGICPSLFGGGVHGEDEISVYRELCQVTSEWEAHIRKKTKWKAKGRSSGQRVHR